MPGEVDVERPDNEGDKGAPTTSLDTPAIELETGSTTDNPCVPTRLQAHAILRDNCSKCHQAPKRQGQPPFDYVLEVDRLLVARSATVKDAETGEPARFLVPGEPNRSRLYLRIVNQEMPPKDVVGLPPNSDRPTTADMSVLRTWIVDCLSDPAPAMPPADEEAGSNDAGASATEDAGVVNDAGTTDGGSNPDDPDANQEEMP